MIGYTVCFSSTPGLDADLLQLMRELVLQFGRSKLSDLQLQEIERLDFDCVLRTFIFKNYVLPRFDCPFDLLQLTIDGSLHPNCSCSSRVNCRRSASTSQNFTVVWCIVDLTRVCGGRCPFCHSLNCVFELSQFAFSQRKYF